MERLDDLLDSGRAAPPDVLTCEQVGGPAAWDVLVRDGALVPLRGRLAVRPGAVVTPALRAGALASVVPRGAVVAGRTAAWVHCGLPDDDSLDLAYAAGRHRPEVWGSVRVWQAPLLRGDTVLLGGVRVTTPERTVVDLALREDPAVALPAALALVAACGVAIEDAARRLEARARAVGRPRARQVLADARAALDAVGALVA